ncbi:hypothetical protein JR316_0000938 [Psilocybe cubensis]|uniref:Uncharacterized protein n=2 Tax=Psilocybe cubensis TaxID=181762 RepID=A0ACB8HFT7_PSICU|nr:hypothetical protein JR316_0000938 [Psilocybe cubensis]KAH9486873.1 hypothetical protein JR316_0000938 [Psilocybe cubensis]
MFSQFRNAVEQLAQQPIRVLEGSSPESTPAEHTTPSRSQSLDIQANRSASPLSSTQLAESAISSLRKSFASQRIGGASSSPSPKANTPEPAAPAPRKSNLEERLRRATFAIGEASGSSTPQHPSRVASPSPMGRNRKPKPEQSASSTPPSASPSVTTALEAEKKLDQSSDIPVGDTEVSTAQPPSDAKEAATDSKPSNIEKPVATETIATQTTAETAATTTNVIESSEDPLGIAKPDESIPCPPEETPAISNLESKEETSVSNIDDNVPPTPATTLTVETSASLEPDEGVSIEVASEETKGKEITAESTSVVTAQHEGTSKSADADDTKEVTPTVDSGLPENSKSTPEIAAEDRKEVKTLDDSSEIVTIPAAVDSPLEDLSSPPQPEATNVVAAETRGEEASSPSAEQSSTVPPVVDRTAEVESLQARLVLIEQRFSDVSASFKRLQAEKVAADAILRESSPLESINDANALREFFDNLKIKDEVYQEELKRLNQKLEVQEARFAEVREIHKLETHSLTDEVKKIRNQLDETEALFQAAQRATSHAEEAVDKQKEDFARLQKEVEAAKNTAKEEEEKRVKAISLLKTVRQKLVKAEKDKEDAMKEIAAIKEREKNEKNQEQIDRLNFQQELEAVQTKHDEAVANLKAQFAKEMTSTKERYEQEINALRGQMELDVASSKATHIKEIGTKNSQITTLETSLNNVTRDKNAFFDQLQLRQAELESAQGHLESLQHENAELQFQLRESTDRLSLLKEEYSELLREHDSRSRDPVTSADEVARMVSATEVKYEAKLAEMKRNIAILEKERAEGEADWSKKLKEKVKELEDTKRILGSAARNREADENAVAVLRADLAHAHEMNQKLQKQVSELPHLQEQIQELQKAAKDQEEEISVKISVLEKQIEESKSREAQLKQANKTLREELRKVQSSAALLERQRNPGVGYWTTRAPENGGSADGRRPSVSTPPPETPARVSSPAPSTTSNKNEEEVNLEYLRNVILQFLEHKEMRPNLVKVLSIILHFTPQETRRLIAKV